MTRRPKSRLPPKLPDPARERPPAAPRQPSRRERLKDAHVAGRSARFTRDDMERVSRSLVRGDTTYSLGVPRFTNLTIGQARAAIELVYGWDGESTRPRIDPQYTLVAFERATERILEVAGGGGRLAFATARPASLLGVYRALATAAADAGGVVLGAAQSSLIEERRWRLWWLDGVAAVTDGENLLAHSSAAAADELLFVLPRPDLVVADGWFAGAALGAGLEVVAAADFDAVALAVAAWRGMAIRVVPLDECRAPHAYLPLLETLGDAVIACSLDDPFVVLAGRSHPDGPRSGS
jgi:Phosphatase